MFVSAALQVLAAAVAIAPTPTASPSAQPEIAHVVTTDRVDESVARAVRTTYVVTSAQMTQLGYRTVADALESVPGVNVERYGAFGSGSSVSIRGSSTSQVLVLVDGLPSAGQETGSFDFDTVSTAGLDRIEVVEGGGSTLYGSSSIGGVVNIITRNHTGYDALASVGTLGESTYRFDTPYVSYERTYAANNFTLPDGTTRQNADGAISAGSLHYAHTLGAINASFFAGLSNDAVGVPGELTVFSPTSRQSSINQDVRASFSYARGRSFATLDVGTSRYAVTFACDTPTDPNCLNNYVVPLPTSFLSIYSESRTSASLRNAVGDESYRLIYGADFSRGNGTLNDGVDAAAANPYSQSAAYMQSQWFARNGNAFYIGLRGERDDANGAASPSLGGNVNLSRDLVLKLNASTAFRAPNLEELYYPGASNPALVPERTRNADATIVAKNVLGGTSFGWFTTNGSNLITFDLATFMPQNVQRAAISGFTFSTKTKPAFGYTATLDVTNLYEANDLRTGARLDARGPVFKARTTIVYAAPARSNWDSYGILATTEGARGYVNYALPTFDQPVPFTRFDAFLSYRIAPRAILSLRAWNLTNQRYAEFGSFDQSSSPYDYYPLPGRSFSIELRTR